MAPLYLIYRESYFGDAKKLLPKNLKSFYYIRHGQTDANLAGLAQGWTDNPLNAKGEQQATATEPIVRALGIKKLVCSPLTRARQTAKLASTLAINTEHMLKERGFGKNEGTKPDPAMYRGNYEDCEDTVKFSSRVARGMHHCTTDGTLISGHGDVLRVIMGMLNAEVSSPDEFGNAQVLFFQHTIAGWKVHNLSAQVIIRLQAEQLLDTKGRPVLEARITTARGIVGETAAATGSTVGGFEPVLLKDGDKSNYNGASVNKAVNIVNTIIADALHGMNVFDQEGIDRKMRELDGTDDFSKLGGNSVASVSFAALYTATKALGVPLYEYVNHGPIKSIQRPIFNIVNGNRKGDRLDLFYEYIIVPHVDTNLADAVRMAVEIYTALPKAWLEIVGHKPVSGSSYGYEAHSPNPADVLDLMTRAIELAGHTGKMCFAVDCAAVDVYDEDTKTYPWMGKRVSAKELIAAVKPLTEKYPLLFIEDLLADTDFVGHALARKELTRTTIIGDDLTASNKGRLIQAVKNKSIDGFILKLNQSGTITDAKEALDYAGEKGLFVVASGRSGGTLNDPTREFAIGSPTILLQKVGAPTGGNNVAGINKMCRAAGYGSNVPMANVSRLIRFV